jgi:ubiquinone/menaquinone biosynthesis C-methylase UbiE
MGARSLAGIDIDADRVAYSKTRFDADSVRISCSMAEDLPIEDDSVDLISCLEVIEHVQDPDKVLSEMHRVLRKEGMAVITFPSYDAISGPHLDHIIGFPWLQHFIGLEGLREKARKKHLKATGEDIQEWDPLNNITIRKFKQLLNGRFEIVHEQILSPYYFCKVMLKLGVMKDLCGDRCRFIVRRS